MIVGPDHSNLCGLRITLPVLETLPKVRVDYDFDRRVDWGGVEVPSGIVAIMFYLRERHAQQVNSSSPKSFLERCEPACCSTPPLSSNVDNMRSFVGRLFWSSYDDAIRLFEDKTPAFVFDALVAILDAIDSPIYPVLPSSCQVLQQYDAMVGRLMPPVDGQLTLPELVLKLRIRNFMCAAIAQDLLYITNNTMRNVVRCIIANLIKLITAFSRHLIRDIPNLSNYPTLEAMALEPTRMQIALDYIVEKLADKLVTSFACLHPTEQLQNRQAILEICRSRSRKTLTMFLVSGASVAFTAHMQLLDMLAHSVNPNSPVHNTACVCLGFGNVIPDGQLHYVPHLNVLLFTHSPSLMQIPPPTIYNDALNLPFIQWVNNPGIDRI